MELNELENLLNINFFVNMSTEGIQKNMDCYVNKNSKTCLVIGQHKCELLYEDRSLEYNKCLLEVYS